MTRFVLLALVAALLAACGGQWLVTARPVEPYDVAIVPGCPCLDDGSLSYCQKGRALWAAELWRRGDVRWFITSGGAVHSPYVEAEAIAQAMVALGVPASRIFLERDALHTDENIYYSMRIARARGLRRMAVATSRAQAKGGCQFLTSDGETSCGALAMDEPAMRALAAAHRGTLDAIRVRKIDPWVDVYAQESRIRERTHRWRPPSWVLYAYEAWLGIWGRMYIPPGTPSRPPIVTYEDLSPTSTAQR